MDGLRFDKLDGGLSEVTGDIKRSTTGFWFDALEEVSSGSLDLGCYVKDGDRKVLDRFWPATLPILFGERAMRGRGVIKSWPWDG
jgi:hypothetical protein